MSPVITVQICETGQPLPPMLRQPGVQRPAAMSQTRPDVAPPQSASAVHPHWPVVRQRAPARSGLHAAVEVGVHSAQTFRVGSQTNGGAQSAVTRHSTQRAGAPARSQRGSGLLQSPSIVQPVVIPHWPAPFTMFMHIWPAGQSLRGAAPHPGVQTPFGPLQMRPDIIPPQAGSASGPEHPQSPVPGRHSGFAPAQRPAFVGEHSVHAPASGPEV
jgi:hypothetical protein